MTGVPLAWLALVTTSAACQKLFSAEPTLGFLAGAAELAAKHAAGQLTPAKALIAGQLVFNRRLCALLTALFLAVLWIVILDAADRVACLQGTAGAVGGRGAVSTQRVGADRRLVARPSLDAASRQRNDDARDASSRRDSVGNRHTRA